MKNKTAIALAATMTTSFFCANSPASPLSDRIKAQTASQVASTFGSSQSSSSSAFIQALKNYDPSAGTSSSLVSKSKVSSTSGSASSLSSLMDQRLAAATLQAQAAKAKATAVNFSSGEYIPTRNVDGYSVTASGVKATPTVKPSAAAPSATLVNKVKIQSAFAQQQAQQVKLQQAQHAAPQQNAQKKLTVSNPVLRGYTGKGNSTIQQINAKLAAADAQYQQTMIAVKAKATTAAKATSTTTKTATANDAKYNAIMANRKANGQYVTKKAAMAKADTQTKSIYKNLPSDAIHKIAIGYASLNGLRVANTMAYDHGVPTPGMDWGIPYHYQSTQKFRSLDVNYVPLAQTARRILSIARR